MTDEFCFDTTILVYAYDESYRVEREACKKLVETVFNGELRGVVTNQILAELFNVLTKKIEKPLDIETSEIIVNSLVESGNWKKINYSHETVKKAITTAKKSKAHFWDCLIAETMKDNGVENLYTENEKDFRNIHGITLTNPVRK
ncbi:MAG: PIN domain-containing protein [Candidatus Aenigmarchaeota archaeon]|nr:PIN domain-containing protein [Candidatus Aenigmarchaeota archaeon]